MRLLLIYYSNTPNVVFTNAQLGVYSGEFIKIKIESDGTDLTISVYGLNNNNTFTFIATQTVTIGGLPNANIVLGAINNGTTITTTYNIDILQFTANGKTWNFSEGTGSNISDTTGTSTLDIAGTLTNFWQKSTI